MKPTTSTAGYKAPYFYKDGMKYSVTQPAGVDHKIMRGDMEELRDLHCGTLTRLQAQQQAAEEGMAKELTKFQREQVLALPDQVRDLESKIAASEMFSRNFGFVKVSSGQSINPVHQNIRDWALIDLDKNRFSQSPTNMVSQDFISSSICIYTSTALNILPGTSL
jgi:hypothetical protein